MIDIKTFGQDITQLQHDHTQCWHNAHEIDDSTDELSLMVVEQHKQNFDLWHEEDKAREPGAEDSVIANVKRNIDAFNQRRNDMVTEIDQYLAEHQLAPFQNEKLPWNSETLGSIVDRLSIASLKVFYMTEQTKRDDASEEHRQICKQKVAKLLLQRQDLATALQCFIDDIIAGRKQNKLYRQFKMYNDPTLNPKIYGKAND